MREKKQIKAAALLFLACSVAPAIWANRVAAVPSAASHAPGGELKIVAADVQLLLIAPNGRETGYDPKIGKEKKTIPESSYYKDALLAFDSGRADTSTTQTIDVQHPAAGKYRLVVSSGGLAEGESYEVRVTLYRADGSEASNARIAGTVKHDKAAMYELRLSAEPATVAIVHRVPGN
ncbi:MAG TPA: hypothetical protein VNK23_12650 [Candidatus Dormibacteraeota bacterium]|nr:hypothetical protein [Candidatus Dormibacteraeota bacterium]